MSATQLRHEDRQAGANRMGLMLALGTETIFFGTILMVYLYLRNLKGLSPVEDHSLERMLLPVGNTAILLLSALSARWSTQSIRRGRVRDMKWGLAGALALGLVFIGGQIAEFNSSGMAPDDTAYGGVFFALMGFHALHVMVGGVVLLINLIRAELGDFSQHRHQAVELGNWFWYYVTGVWAVLFVALYLV